MIENATLTDHTVAVFATHDQAELAIRSLSKSGFELKNLSIIGQNYQSEEHPVGFVNTGDRIWSWGSLGAFWGAIWGMLFGSALMFLPGIGHVMVAGYIVGALQGAFVGGGFGVIGGALASLGVPNESVVQYESELKAGSFLVLAHGSEQETLRAKELLAKMPATRVDSFSTPKIHAGHNH